MMIFLFVHLVAWRCSIPVGVWRGFSVEIEYEKQWC